MQSTPNEGGNSGDYKQLFLVSIRLGSSQNIFPAEWLVYQIATARAKVLDTKILLQEDTGSTY